MSMRMNPAIEGFLNGLGVMTRGVDGHLRDTNDIFEDFIRKMRSEPFPIAAQMAEFLGISPDQLLKLEQGQDARLKAEADYLAKSAAMGINTDEFGKRSATFMNQLRELGNTTELLWQGVGAHMMESLEGPMNALDQFMIAHSKQIIAAEDGIEAALSREAGYWRDIFGWLDKIPGVEKAAEAALAAIGQALEHLALPLSTIVDDWNKLKELWGAGQAELQKLEKQNPGVTSGIRQRLDQVFNWFHKSSYEGAPVQGNAQVLPASYVFGFSEAVRDGTQKALQWFQSQGGFAQAGFSGYEPEQRQAILAALRPGTGGRVIPASYNVGNLAGPNSAGPNGLFASLEGQQGLPAGLLDRVWAQESARGRNLVSPAGALGPFQFMPGTATRFGLTNPFDLVQSASAAARYLRQLLDMFKGNLAEALAGYNWGEANVMRDVSRWGDAWLQHAPWETQNYVNSILGGGVQQRAAPNVHIEQHNEIRSTDPMQAGQEVAVRTRSVWSDVIRVMRQPGVYA